MRTIKKYRIPLLLVPISILFYLTFAYNLTRTDYIKLVVLYGALFYLFYKTVHVLKNYTVFLTAVALIFRALFIVAIPNLSQDFYRFIWDGRIILTGINPYLFTVESFISKGEFPVSQAQELYHGMGILNASHFTNYPPLNQLCFAIAGLISGKSILGSVVVMRLLIIAADFGTLHFGKKLLKELNIPVHNIFFYILNPFIIIELTGNLHFEGIMIFFLIWSLYLLHIGKWWFSAFVLAFSVSVKLIPLIFLPLLFKRLGFKKSILFYGTTGITTLLLFAPFYSSAFINNYFETVALWFQNFEFNASIYYVVRELGYLFRGYNEIAIIGKVIPAIVLGFVVSMAFLKKNKTTIQLIVSCLMVLSFYYFMATTVHPWYVATLLALSVFTNYKFPLVWSFVIILSYLAYANSNNTENLWIIALEYGIVYGVFIWELFFKNRQKLQLTY